MDKLLEEKLDRFASIAMFGQGARLISDVMRDLGLAFKTGKESADVKAAVQKGLAKGCGKTERELLEVSIALSRVLKLKGA
jgi:hypothetical protein